MGRAVIGITDAASLSNVDSVNVTVDEIQVRGENGQWVNVSTDDKQYDLVALKASGRAEIFADVNLPAQTYDKVKVLLKDTSVKPTGKVQVQAMLPNNEMVLDTGFTVRPNETSTAVIDFMLDLDSSLFAASGGRYIYLPVAKVDTRTQANMEPGATVVNQNSGTAESSNVSGMDIDGSTKPNFTIDPGVTLDLIGDDTIYIKSVDGKDTSLKINVQQALDRAKADGFLDSQSSIRLMDQNGQKIWVISGPSGSVDSSIGIDANTGAVVDLNSSSGGSLQVNP